MKVFIQASFFLVAWTSVFADIYLHNPRGSNNRLDENANARKNKNRLFNSQNNDQGGYNVGGLIYYSGSQLQVEWTNQHSCQSPNSNCEIILQYMCEDYIRDGTSTETIPLSNDECENNNCEEDEIYGMNEDYLYYQHCRSQERNKGLFVANQKLKGNSALFTRQNSNGDRYGYECPEERDYYPYWRSTPWKDIVVLTNNASRCPYYQQESENIKSKESCELPKEVLNDLVNRALTIPRTKEACETFSYPPNTPTARKAVWTEYPSHGIESPECRETEFTRDNHLGNTLDGNHFNYMWTLPDFKTRQKCALRIRYNISTTDYDGWDPNINSRLNKNSIPLASLNSKWDLQNDSTDTSKMGYNFQNNPQVQLFPGLDLKLQLSINTAQYGRVFEDRSHTFGIIPRSEIKSEAVIHNLNVRGKRGNIVQTYPAVEYDFVPQTLEIAKGDYVHIQWTGSNNNPENNDGEGSPGTDRSNLVLLEDLLEDHPDNTFGHLGQLYPKTLNESNSFLDLKRNDLELLAYLRPGLATGSISTLDDAGTYFNLGLRQINRSGTYNFMCTRNNNFSNRSQKGTIIVSDCTFKQAVFGWNGGNFTVGSTNVRVERGLFKNLMKLRLEEWTLEDIQKADKLKSLLPRINHDLASNIIVLEPESLFTENGSESLQMQITMTKDRDKSFHLYRTSTSDSSIWQRIDADKKDGVVSFKTDRGGVYLIQRDNNSNLIIAAVVVPLILVLITVGAFVYFYRNKKHWTAVKNIGRKTKRSMQNSL